MSLVTFAVVICLFFSEIVWYRTTRVENHLLVDTSQVRSFAYARGRCGVAVWAWAH